LVLAKILPFHSAMVQSKLESLSSITKRNSEERKREECVSVLSLMSGSYDQQ
jgi:hypothetical protein